MSERVGRRAEIGRAHDGLDEAYADERSADARVVALRRSLLERMGGRSRVLVLGPGSGWPVLVRLAEHATAYGLDLSR